jgi:tetratricopeptide (TPR) repeat protein
MVKRWDPELHTDRFMVIQQAYDKLRDPPKRAKEDLFTYNYVRGDFNYTAEEKGDTPNQTELVNRLKTLSEAVKGSDPEANGARQETVTLLLMSSYRHFLRKQWKEAISDLVRALELDPTNQRGKNNLNLAYMRLGWSYATNNLIKEAIELWESSLQINPDNPPVIHNLAIACEQDGQRDKADRYWAETLRRWRTELDGSAGDDYVKHLLVEAHKHFGGRDLSGRADGGAAIEEYREALKIDPDDFEAQLKISEALIEQKKYSEAVVQLRKLASKHRENIQVLNLYSWALLNSGEIDQAFTNWQRCLKLDSNNYAIKQSMVKARFDLARKCRESGQFTPALVHFKALLKMLPKSPEVHQEIAQTYLAKGDQSSAFKHFTIVTQLDPRNKDAKKAISDMRMRRN